MRSWRRGFREGGRCHSIQGPKPIDGCCAAAGHARETMELFSRAVGGFCLGFVWSWRGSSTRWRRPAAALSDTAATADDRDNRGRGGKKKLKFRREERLCSRSAPDGIVSGQAPPMIGQRNRKGNLVTRRAELLKLLIFAQGQERNQEQGHRIDCLSN